MGQSHTQVCKGVTLVAFCNQISFYFVFYTTLCPIGPDVEGKFSTC